MGTFTQAFDLFSKFVGFVADASQKAEFDHGMIHSEHETKLAITTGNVSVHITNDNSGKEISYTVYAHPDWEKVPVVINELGNDNGALRIDIPAIAQGSNTNNLYVEFAIPSDIVSVVVSAVRANVVFSNCQTRSMSAKTEKGDIVVKRVEFDTAAFETQDGDIVAKHLPQECNFELHTKGKIVQDGKYCSSDQRRLSCASGRGDIVIS